MPVVALRPRSSRFEVPATIPMTLVRDLLAIGLITEDRLSARSRLESALDPRTLAALQPIVEEAGGRFSNLSGVDGPDGGSVVCSNGLLHDDVLAALAPR